MDKPVPPVPPADGDCCGTGCIPCVMDIYEEALEDYRAKLAEWEAHAKLSQAITNGTAA